MTTQTNNNEITTAADFRARVAADSGKFSPRTRFNWGYHDGAADGKNGREPVCDIDSHHDFFYAVAYRMGRDDVEFGDCAQSSERAWLSCYGAASAAHDGQALENPDAACKSCPACADCFFKAAA